MRLTKSAAVVPGGCVRARACRSDRSAQTGGSAPSAPEEASQSPPRGARLDRRRCRAGRSRNLRKRQQEATGADRIDAGHDHDAKPRRRTQAHDHGSRGAANRRAPAARPGRSLHGRGQAEPCCSEVSRRPISRPIRSSWRPRRPARVIGHLPSARHDTAAATIGRFVYLFGGGNGVSQLDDIVRVDPATGSARLVGRLPAASSDSSAAAIGGTAYVVGGYTGTALARHDRRVEAGWDRARSSLACRSRFATQP